MPCHFVVRLELPLSNYVVVYSYSVQYEQVNEKVERYIGTKSAAIVVSKLGTRAFTLDWAFVQ